MKSNNKKLLNNAIHRRSATSRFNMNEKRQLSKTARDDDTCSPGSSLRSHLRGRAKKGEDLHLENIPSHLVEGYRPADFVDPDEAFLLNEKEPIETHDDEVPGTPTAMQPDVANLDLPHAESLQIKDRDSLDALAGRMILKIHRIENLPSQELEVFFSSAKEQQYSEDGDNWEMPKNRKRKRIEHLKSTPSSQSSKKKESVLKQNEKCEVSAKIKIMDKSNNILLDNSGILSVPSTNRNQALTNLQGRKLNDVISQRKDVKDKAVITGVIGVEIENIKSPSQTRGSLLPLSAGGQSIVQTNVINISDNSKSCVNVGGVILSDNDIEPMDVVHNPKLDRNLATEHKPHREDLSQEDGSVRQPHSSRRQSSVNLMLSVWQGQGNSSHENLIEVTSSEYEENIYACISSPIQCNKQTSTSMIFSSEIRMGNSQGYNVFDPQNYSISTPSPTLVHGFDIIGFPYPHSQEFVFPQYNTPELSIPTYFFPIPVIPMFPYPIFPDGTIHYL